MNSQSTTSLRKMTRAFAAVALIAALGRLRARHHQFTPGDAPNLEKWVADVQARPAPPLEPLPVMQQFETFEYAAQGLRDPFSDAWSNADSGGLRPDPNRRKETLEQFPLDSLDMVGTIGKGAGAGGIGDGSRQGHLQGAAGCLLGAKRWPRHRRL